RQSRLGDTAFPAAAARLDVGHENRQRTRVNLPEVGNRLKLCAAPKVTRRLGSWQTRLLYYAHVWTCSALDRLLGDQDQVEVRSGSSRAECSGVVERVPDRSDAGGRPQQGRQARPATDAVGARSAGGEGGQGRFIS